MDTQNNWVKLADYPTDLLAQTHAVYLQNNGINVQTQLNDLIGLNTGGALWVETNQLTQARELLDNIAENLDDNFMTESSHLDDNDQPDVQG